jgi:glyceraldehyde-3-phosphate dehydrogenase (NAD(P))
VSLPAIGVIGYGQLGKRVVDALTRQPDVRVAGVFDDDPQRARLIQARGLPHVARDLADWASRCHVVVVCSETYVPLYVPTVYAPEVPATSLKDGEENAMRCRIPCADALAFARLVACLPPVERLFSSCARRTGGVTDHHFARVNALEPLFELPAEDVDVRAVLSSVESVMIRRTRVPYTQSHVHHLKLDFTTPVPRDTALAALKSDPRIRVAAGVVGLTNTGLLQEYDRDLGRPRGDRPEVFIWEETVASVERSLFVTIDVDPDATPVLEVIDAVRRLAYPTLSLVEVQKITNGSLGIGSDG